MTSDKPFTKYDKGKAEFQLIAQFYDDLGICNEVLEMGAKKYGRDNWKKGNTPEDIQRYKNAALRHIFASMNGESKDAESGRSHLYHALCSLLFASWHERIINDSGRCNLRRDAPTVPSCPDLGDGPIHPA